MEDMLKNGDNFFLGPSRGLKNLQAMIMLWVISETSPNGITGYQLQNNYGIPQTTVYRMLSNLKDEGYASIDEEIVNGRKQKRYKITSEGMNRLEELKKVASGKIALLFNVLTPDERAKEPPFLGFSARYRIVKHQLELADTKEKVMEILKHVIDFMENQARMLRHMTSVVEKDQEMVEQLMKTIEDSEIYSKEFVIQKIGQFLANRIRRFFGEGRKANDKNEKEGKQNERE
ncbi:hypothetical protein GF325_05020 [Candidatus Bathyarchaeota archaeon]|nr:hypothetical protein [Candidatus Bathyarchaeota archaeon]